MTDLLPPRARRAPAIACRSRRARRLAALLLATGVTVAAGACTPSAGSGVVTATVPVSATEPASTTTTSTTSTTSTTTTTAPPTTVEVTTVPPPPPPPVPRPVAPAPTTPPAPAPRPAPAPAAPPAAPAGQQGVHPGAFCSPGGATGYTSAGTRMVCSTTASDSRNRWRSG
jgi:hypothetical protein